jgi:hypothetical protein
VVAIDSRDKAGTARFENADCLFRWTLQRGVEAMGSLSIRTQYIRTVVPCVLRSAIGARRKRQELSRVWEREGT